MYASNNRKEKRKNTSAGRSSPSLKQSCNSVTDSNNKIINVVQTTPSQSQEHLYSHHNHHHNHHQQSHPHNYRPPSSSSGGKNSSAGRVYDQDTKLLKFMCPSSYQEETFKFLYDFFTKDEQPDSLYASEKNMFNIFTTVIDDDDDGSEILREFIPSTLSDYVQQESAQVMILDQTLMNQQLTESLRSFPTIRLVHESMSTCPLVLSECTMKYFILVLEVKIGLLYRQCVVNRCVDNVSVSSGNPKIVADEDVFCQLKDMWRNYVLRDKHNPHGKKGVGVLRNKSVCTEDDSYCVCGDIDEGDEYMKSIHFNDLVSTIVKKPSLLIDFNSFKIEEIQKGTSINRLKKKTQFEIGKHTSSSYVCPFAKLYDSYVEQCKQAVKHYRAMTCSAWHP